MRSPVLLALTLAAALVVTTQGPAAAASSARRESDVVKHTNAERTQRDLRKLSASACLDRYAEAHARRQAKARKVSRPPLSTVRRTCRLSTVGVRVASGRSSGRSVVKGWMRSSKHRKYLLRSGYRVVGVGAAKAGNGRWYYAMVLGTRRPASSIATRATTGVPSGTRLTAARGMTITKDGTVVSAKDVSGGIWIDADDVTIRSSRVTGTGFAVIQVKDGSRNVRIQDVEIDGQGAQAGSMGVIGPAAVTRADISGVENGLTPGSGSQLRNNWVHDLDAPGSPHYDGIQIDGGLSDITISGNHVDLSNHTQTSAVMIDNYFGPISNVSVVGNRLEGGGYTVYSDGQFGGGAIRGVSFTGNRLGKGYYGYASIVRNSPTWSGNTDATTGRSVGR
jgi:hypothetical protein